MTWSLGVVEALERVGRRLQQSHGDEPIPLREIVQQVVAECGCGSDSVLPSDHCYDRINDGIALVSSDGPREIDMKWRPMFEHVGHDRSGLYRFRGRDYAFTGRLVHYPKGGTPREVGQWVKGELRYTGGPAAAGE